MAGAGRQIDVNDDVFDWNTLPKRVAVFGQGIIGLELGGLHSRDWVYRWIFWSQRPNLGGITDPVVLVEAKTIFHERIEPAFEHENPWIFGRTGADWWCSSRE